MSNYVWDIRPGQKTDLIELARTRFYDASDFYEAVSVSRSSVNSHLNGDSEKIDLEVAETLLNVVDSEPRYQLEQPFDREEVLEQTVWAGEEKVKLEDDYKDFLLKPCTEKELEEVTDYSESSINNYRRKGRKIPKDFYIDVFKDVKNSFETEIRPEGDIHYNSPDLGNEETEHSTVVIENASREDVEEIGGWIRSLNQWEEREPWLFGRLMKNLDFIDGVYESFEDETDYVTVDGKDMGFVYSRLEDLGALERFSVKNRRVNYSEDWLETLEKYLHSRKEDTAEKLEYTDEELIDLVKDLEQPTKERFGETYGPPWPETVVNHFGSWNNALWYAGENPGLERYDEGIVTDMLLRKSEELESKVGKTDLREDSNMPSPAVVRKYMVAENLEEACQKAGIKHDREKIREEVLESLYDGKWKGREIVEQNAHGHRSSEGIL